MLVGMLNMIDRFLPSILVEPIKRDLQLSDTAIGLINGFGFLIIYATLGIPIARLSDRGRYGLVISCCLGLWSFMTMLGAAAQNGWHLALTRMGVAVGEAGSTPAAHAYISRNFPPTGRGAPLAVLTLSMPVAGMIGLMAGGMLGDVLGWRMTFVIMGLIGLVLAPLTLLVLGARQDQPPNFVRDTSLRPALILLKKPSFVAILAGSAFVGIGGYSQTTFAPAFLIRVHGMSLSEVGVQYGLVSGAAGIVSLILTAIIADRLSTRDPRWILGVVALMIALCLPFSFAAFLVQDRLTALSFMAISYIIGIAYLAPVVAAMQRLVPVELRATASAILLFCAALFGGAGPLLTGMISDALQAELGPKALGRALLVAPLFYTLAGISFLVATRTFRRDMVAEDAVTH